jgi:hypothetical protein
MKEVPGLINAKNPRPPNPKPSPKDFVWPSQRDADETVAKKIAASLQELLPKRDWKHVDLAKALWGTHGANDAPRNTQAPRRWVVADLPIPSERDAGYIAEILGVSMARLLEPEGKFDPLPPMIRPRSDSPRFNPGLMKKKKKGKKAKAAAAPVKAKRKYTRKAAQVNGAEKVGWKLADGVDAPDYTITSADCPPGHLKLELTAVLPHERTMAILHMLQHEGEGLEG